MAGGWRRKGMFADWSPHWRGVFLHFLINWWSCVTHVNKSVPAVETLKLLGLSCLLIVDICVQFRIPPSATYSDPQWVFIVLQSLIDVCSLQQNDYLDQWMTAYWIPESCWKWWWKDVCVLYNKWQEHIRMNCLYITMFTYDTEREECVEEVIMSKLAL